MLVVAYMLLLCAVDIVDCGRFVCGLIVLTLCCCGLLAWLIVLDIVC